MESAAAVRAVLIYTLLLNLLVSAVKIVVGHLTGSLGILAGGFDSLFDSLTNVIGLIAISLSRRPPDEDHPYGHRRYETLMTLIISILLFSTCYNILRSAYQRILNPIVPQVNLWSFASLLLSIAVQAYTSSYELRRGRELRSEFLIADGSHSRADILVTSGLIANVILVRMGYPAFDTLVAVLIALLIAKIGIDIIRSSTPILTDAAALDATKVAAIVQQVPGVESYHHIRSRGLEDDIHLDLHVRVAPDMPMAQAHLIAHEVQRRLQQALEGVRDVVVHVEPQRGGSTGRDDDLLAKVKQAASGADATIHHVNTYEVDGRYSVGLHIEVPDGLTLGEAHARASLLEASIRAQIPEIAEISTHIEPAQGAHAVYEGPWDNGHIEQTVRQLARSVPGVHDCHDIRALRAEGKLLLSLRCELDAELPITEAHDIATRIEERLKGQGSGVERVFVHVEPAPGDAPSA
ncbi:MAG: cation-efflux pump [Anaerolineales bacterium]|nr:MAG: cation-efflux pump [Anaerolineales bacterium]